MLLVHIDVAPSDEDMQLRPIAAAASTGRISPQLHDHGAGRTDLSSSTSGSLSASLPISSGARRVSHSDSVETPQRVRAHEPAPISDLSPPFGQLQPIATSYSQPPVVVQQRHRRTDDDDDDDDDFGIARPHAVDAAAAAADPTASPSHPPQPTSAHGTDDLGNSSVTGLTNTVNQLVAEQQTAHSNAAINDDDDDMWQLSAPPTAPGTMSEPGMSPPPPSVVASDSATGSPAARGSVIVCLKTVPSPFSHSSNLCSIHDHTVSCSSCFWRA